MEEVRSVTRAGEADEVHRVTLSLSPGRPPAAVIESSAYLLRAEVVDGELVGTARVATAYRDDSGAVRTQANVIAPEQPDAAARVATLAARAARLASPPLPDFPAVAVTLREPVASVALTDADALDRRFLEGLRHATAGDVRAFKERNLAHEAGVASGRAPAGLDPDNVAWIQSASLAAHGRPLAGEALEHAHFVLTHEGLYRADGGPLAAQLASLRERAIPPWAPGREMDDAADERTRRLLRLAGVDEQAAREEIRDGLASLVARSREGGGLRRDVLPAGTRVVTASQCGDARGVQWTTATRPLEAHLVEPLPLTTNAGRYVAGLALGRDLAALAEALDRESSAAGAADARIDVDSVLVPALAAALAEPAGPRRLVARVAGHELVLALADIPRAGALARCKNATIFPPAYGVTLTRPEEVVLAATPVVTIGAAETDTEIAGESWVGWRRLALIGAVPFLLADDDDGDSRAEPEPEPPREGIRPRPRERAVVPPIPPRVGRPQPPVVTVPRDGSGPAGGGRGGRTDPPEPPRPRPPGDDEPAEPPRGGDEPPGGGRGGRTDPPEPPHPEPPGDEPPREGDEPPGGDRPDRPQPPEPPDRPRRPVD